MTSFAAAQALLDDAGCLSCFTPYQLMLINTQLLSNINEGGGGGTTNSCLVCGDTDPVAAPDCDCALGINRVTGALFYWNSTTASWVPLIVG